MCGTLVKSFRINCPSSLFGTTRFEESARSSRGSFFSLHAVKTTSRRKDDASNITEDDSIDSSLVSLPDLESATDDTSLTIERTLELPATNLVVPVLILNIVTVIWGTQHAVIKQVLDSGCSPSLLLFARFAMASLLFTPWMPGLLEKSPLLPFSDPEQDTSVEGEGTIVKSAKETWQAGAEMGIWTFAGFALQAVGLGDTTATRSAFLLYLNVKLVPLFGLVLYGKKSPASVWIGAFVAVLGTALLCNDSSPPNIGDFWSIMAAAASAMYILRLEKYANKHNAAELSSASLAVTALLCGIWAFGEAGLATSTGRDLGDIVQELKSFLQESAPMVVYLAVVATASCNWLQAVGQRSVPAERAALIYAMDGVYAAFFSHWLLGEQLGAQGIAGAGLITAAALLNQKTMTQGKDSDTPAP